MRFSVINCFYVSEAPENVIINTLRKIQVENLVCKIRHRHDYYPLYIVLNLQTLF